MTGSEHCKTKRKCLAYTEMTPSGQKVDNSGSTLQKLFQLYRQADLCDVQLQVGIHLFHTHKLILSMSSDVLKTMLTDVKWPDARKTRIVLNEEPECVKVFGEFLQYMYTGNIHLNNASVLPVLTLADKYNIHDLGNVCRQYMLSHSHASVDNLKVISWLQYAILCNDRDLEQALRRYVELNFNHVMQSTDFLTMRLDTLDEVLHSQHLVVHSEYSLFLGLKRWLMHNTGSVGGKQSIARGFTAKKTCRQIMSHIRLPLLKHSQLLILQADSFVQKHADFFVPKLQTAWSVHMYPQCKDRWCLGGTVKHTSGTFQCSINTTLNQHSKCSRNFGNEGFSGSRTVLPINHSGDHSEKAASLQHITHRFFPVTAFAAGDSMESLVSNSGLCSECCAHWLDHSAIDPVNSVIPSSSSNSREGSACIVPRNYTCDDWSTCLTIEEFTRFPHYGSHTYFFSTPASALPYFTPVEDLCIKSRDRQEETDDSTMLEWQAELYPKGVRFPQAKMIGIPNNYDIDEHCQDVVRLAVSSKTHHQQPCRVDISVLAVATGTEDGLEYMEALAHKSCIFDAEHTLHNIDNIVSFLDLNSADSKYLTESVATSGSGRTCFKVVVVIKPRY